MGRGDSCKLVVKAFVYWVWGPWFLAQEGRYSTLGAKPVSERGVGGCGKGLLPGAISSVLSPGLEGCPLLECPGTPVPRAYSSPAAPFLWLPVWMHSHADPTFLTMVLPLITPSPCTGKVTSRTPVCTSRPAPQVPHFPPRLYVP